MKNKLLNRIFNWNRNNLPIESLRTVNLSDLHKITKYGTGDDYDNAYSSIRAISDQFLQIKVFGIDSNGKPLDPTPNAIKRISIPNTEMSGVDFKDMLATRSQVYDKTYILVHEVFGRGTRPATENLREDRIAGYTFLDGVVEDKNPATGELVYKVWVGTEERHYYPYQVMTFYDVNPAAVGRGYSPVRAAKRWSRIEDYIADYQAGFFENGAVPAGQFLITAPTTTEFDDIVDNLEKKHRGAGANNNVVYTYQPIDPNTGKAAQASITWVPFNTTNKDLSLKDILTATNAKTDSVYRVSAMQRAITDAPNFATAQVDDRNFIEKTIRPFTLKRWQRFQHELNRITGGLGYGISFKLDTPYVAEEDKAKAETNKIIWETIKDMMAEGFTYDSACNALKLPPNWKTLEVGDSKETTIENDKADVATDDDVEDLPKPQNGAAKRTNPKAEYTTDDIDQELAAFELQIANVLNAKMTEQVEAAQNEANMATDEEMTDEIVAILTAILLLRSHQAYQNAIDQAIALGIPVSKLEEIAVEFSEADREEILGFIKDYNDQTLKDIAKIKDNSDPSVVTALLAGYVASQAWRVERWSKNESWRASEIGGVRGMEVANDQLVGAVVKKVWHIEPDACPLCVPFAGETVDADKPFSNGQMIPYVHVSCRCHARELVVLVDVENSVTKELHCKHCDRFLGETNKNEYTDRLKCSNSKCKTLDVPVLIDPEPKSPLL